MTVESNRCKTLFKNTVEVKSPLVSNRTVYCSRHTSPSCVKHSDASDYYYGAITLMTSISD